MSSVSVHEKVLAAITHVPSPTEALDATFDKLERQRQASFEEDEEEAHSFFTLVKAFIEEAGDQRKSCFEKFSEDMTQHFELLLARSSEAQVAFDHTYDLAEARRDEILEDFTATTELKYAGLRRQITTCIKAANDAQASHLVGCFHAADDLLATMEKIIEDLLKAFGSHISFDSSVSSPSLSPCLQPQLGMEAEPPYSLPPGQACIPAPPGPSPKPHPAIAFNDPCVSPPTIALNLIADCVPGPRDTATGHHCTSSTTSRPHAAYCCSEQ